MLAHPVFRIAGAIHERLHVGTNVGMAVLPLLGFVLVGPGEGDREERAFLVLLPPNGSPDVSDADVMKGFLFSCHGVFSFSGC